MEIENILGYLLNTAARFIKRQMDKEIEAHNITTSQWAVLKTLSSKGVMTQAQIADSLLSDRATVGTVLFKLIDKGLVAKSLDTKDRRAYVVQLTDSAKDLVKEIEKKAMKVTEQALIGINEHEQKNLYECLNQIIENLSREE